ncbi:GIY-YIG catalytic domain protein [compost metagenome]
MENYKELIKESYNYFGVIYILKNRINNKIYVGQTTNLKRRIKEYRVSRIYKKSMQYALMEDIVKYGYDQFDIDILDNGDTVSELHEKEIYWIDKLNATDVSIGYNKKSGGKGGIMTDDSKTKMSETSSLFKHSDETKILKSIPIVVFSNNKFKYYHGSKSFADTIGVDRSIVSSAIRNCKFLYGKYYVFYWDKELRDKILKRNANKRDILTFQEISKFIGEDVETIENRFYVVFV